MTKAINGVQWYKSLNMDQRFGLRECAHMICGMKWEQFTLLFTPRQRLEMLFNKLKLEGFDI